MLTFISRVAFFLSLASVLGASGTSSTSAQGTAAASREIDSDVWSVFVATVASDDIVRMGSVYFPDAVLVTPRGTSPIKETLERWGRDMVAAQAKGNRATVEFRFSRRQDNATTAFEAGIFKYTVIEKSGASPEVLSIRAAPGEDERQVARAHGTSVRRGDSR